MDDDAIDMGDVGVGTDVDVNLGGSGDGDEAEVPKNLGLGDAGSDENPGVDDGGSDEKTEMNDVESEGVDELNTDTTSQEADDVEHLEEKDDNESTKDESMSIMETRDETEDETGYNLRGNRGRSYKHLYDPEVFDTGKGNEGKGAVMMTTTNEAPEETAQMSMKKQLKVFREPGYAADKKEMQQLHDRKVMQPINRKDLSLSQKKEALGYLMFLKKKRCGTIKGHGCADGGKQQAYITKEESTSPTISTEAMFLTAIIDAWENHKVVVLDVPGAFMQVDMDELVHVWLQGKMVDKLLEIDHDLYASYVSMENGEKVMYVELLKALYGTLRATQLFWEKLQTKLVNEWGFTPNQYDSCVVNKMVAGKQLTVAWHVDDLKISHEKDKALDEFIGMMQSEFGQDAPLSVSHGPVQDYLGMTLDFSEKGRVMVKCTIM